MRDQGFRIQSLSAQCAKSKADIAKLKRTQRGHDKELKQAEGHIRIWKSKCDKVVAELQEIRQVGLPVPCLIESKRFCHARS